MTEILEDGDDWETILAIRGNCGVTFDEIRRYEVPGGWLYRTVLRDEYGEREDIVAMVFVPQVTP